MKLVVALALLSNAAAFLAPVTPRAATQLKLTDCVNIAPAGTGS